jgi:O-antigen/teichoic acid export membrane protein
MSTAEQESIGLRYWVRSLSAHSAVYLVVAALGRSVSLLLVPLYTAVLAPAQYGVLAIALTINALLTLVLGMALHSAIARLYFEAETDEERGQLYGTLLAFLVVVPGIVCLLIELAGRAGALDFSAEIPYDPYLSLTVWASYFGVFLVLPQTIYITRQEPAKVLWLTLSNAVVMVAATVVLVVGLDQGVAGALRALLASAAFTGIVSIVLTARMSSGRVSPAVLRTAMIFAVPLLPHLLGHWLLNLSDRIILNRYVSQAGVGIYTFAYQFGLAMAVFTLALSNALSPIMMRQLKDPATRDHAPPTGTYALLAVTAVGLAIVLFAEEGVRLLAPDSYGDAAALVPWIVLAYVFQGVYYVWQQGTWYSMRTALVPVLTLACATLNVAMNLVLVPRYGIEAAAITTAVSFLALAVAQGLLAQKLHHIDWEYGRWLKLLVAALVPYGAARVAAELDMPARTAGDVVLLCVGFPLMLVALGFWTARERALIRSGLRAIRGAAAS